MDNLSIFATGLVALALATILQPFRSWLSDLVLQKYMLFFLLPLFVLLSWPRETFEAFREGEDFGWLRVARIILFVGFLAVTGLITLHRKQLLVVPRSNILKIFALYTLFAGFSAFYSKEPLQSLWKAFELFVILIFSIQIYNTRINPVLHAKLLTNAMLYISFAFCLMSIVGGILAPDRAWSVGLSGTAKPSMSGVVPMINSNMLGQLGGILGLTGIFRLLTLPKTLTWGDWLLPIVGMTTLILAYSRTCLLTFAVLFLIMVVYLRRWWLLLFSAFLLVLGIGIFLDPIIIYLARGQSAEQLASVSGRTEIWKASLAMWQTSPWIGHGYFVGQKYVEMSLGNNAKFLTATADNTYIETLVNLGIVGFGLIVGFVVFVIRLTWLVLYKFLKLNIKNIIPIAVTLSIFIGFIIIRSLTASSFQVLHYNLLFLMIAVAALHLLNRSLQSRVYPH